MTVQTIPEIEEMTDEQQIELLGALWKNMDARNKETTPPAWHQAVLEERVLALSRGETEFVDWTQAKADILKETIDRAR